MEKLKEMKKLLNELIAQWRKGGGRDRALWRQMKKLQRKIQKMETGGDD